MGNNIECKTRIIMKEGEPVQLIMQDCSWIENEKIVVTLPFTVIAIKENDQNPAIATE